MPDLSGEIRPLLSFATHVTLEYLDEEESILTLLLWASKDLLAALSLDDSTLADLLASRSLSVSVASRSRSLPLTSSVL